MSQYNAEGRLPPASHSSARDIRRMTQPQGEPIRRGQRVTPKTIRETFRDLEWSAPRKVGEGAAAFTPTLTIERQPIRWDTNCFYRRLGLTTSASRLDILRVYLDLDPQQYTKEQFLRFSTAAEVLLSKTKRQRYDALPLGSFYKDDPDLIKSRLDGSLGSAFQVAWTVYADPKISDADALTLSSDWRNSLSAMLASRFRNWPLIPQVGVGVCSSIFESRWEQVGYLAVFFVPLDGEATPEYVHAAADELMRIATPTVITD